MNRAQAMKEHLVGQFAEKPNLCAVLDVLGAELDEVHAVFDDFMTRRWIDTGEGKQLDGIGEIVGQSRQIYNAVQIAFFGFEDQDNALGFDEGRFRDSWEVWLKNVNLNDAEYRPVLWKKVTKNSALGTAEDTIRSLQFAFSAQKVFLHECGNAKISFAIGRKLSRNDISIARAIDMAVRAGGVGVAWQSYFDYDNYFGFLGQLNAKGFEEGTFAEIF